MHFQVISKRQKHLAQSFANLVFQEKTISALHLLLLSDQRKNGILHLGNLVVEQRTVRDILIDKHPPG